jgi:hypothetical protein
MHSTRGMALTRIGKLAVFFAVLIVITQAITMVEVARVEREEGQDIGTQLDMGLSATLFTIVAIILIAMICQAICRGVTSTPDSRRFCAGAAMLFGGITIGGVRISPDVWGLVDGAFA